MPEIKVNGTTLYFEESGHGNPLLFIHGMCGDASVWQDQVKRLNERYRCITYDRRGHSRSPLGTIKERTVELHADDAASLIEKLNIAPCTIVASSGGARIGIDVVRRYPHLLNGAILSEPPLFSLDPSGAKTFMAQVKPAIEEAMSKGGPKAAVDSFFDIVCPGLWGRLSEAQRDKYRNNHVELFGDLQMPQYQISVENLALINLPCLIVRGTESLPVLMNIATIVADSIPNARLLSLAGSGHVTYYEKPQEFASAVLGFASGVKGYAR